MAVMKIHSSYLSSFSYQISETFNETWICMKVESSTIEKKHSVLILLDLFLVEQFGSTLNMQQPSPTRCEGNKSHPQKSNYINHTIASRSNFIHQKKIVVRLVFLGRRSITRDDDAFIVFYFEELSKWRPFWRVFNYASHFCSLNRKLFRVFSVRFKAFVARDEIIFEVDRGAPNKMRTNYSCQIDIVKQFIIGSMSSAQRTAREERSRPRQRHD